MEVRGMNPFYSAAVEHAENQINYLEELLNRQLTEDERENIHEFLAGLDEDIQFQFENKIGRLL